MTDTGLFVAFGPTAAADEFQMLDAMFGNMSPIFPFSDTTPTATAGGSSSDPFGLTPGQGEPPEFESTMWPRDFPLSRTAPSHQHQSAHHQPPQQTQQGQQSLQAQPGGQTQHSRQPQSRIPAPPRIQYPTPQSFDIPSGLTTWTTDPSNTHDEAKDRSINNRVDKAIGDGLYTGAPFKSGRGLTPSEVYRTVVKP